MRKPVCAEGQLRDSTELSHLVPSHFFPLSSSFFLRALLCCLLTLSLCCKIFALCLWDTRFLPGKAFRTQVLVDAGHCLSQGPRRIPCPPRRMLSTRHHLQKGLRSHMHVCQTEAAEPLVLAQNSCVSNGVDGGRWAGVCCLAQLSSSVFAKGRDLYRLQAELNHSEQEGFYLRGLGSEEKERRTQPSARQGTQERGCCHTVI